MALNQGKPQQLGFADLLEIFMCPRACIYHTKTFIPTLIELHSKEKKKNLTQEIKVTEWNKQELWSQNLILPLLALLTLGKIFNSSLYSSVERDGGRLLQHSVQSKCSSNCSVNGFGGSSVTCPRFPSSVIHGHVHVSPIYAGIPWRCCRFDSRPPQ